MTIELFYLLLTTILAGCLWVPYVAGQVMARGMLKPEYYVVPPDSPLPGWVNRANRAHINALENLLPFAVVVFIGHLSDITNSTTMACAAIFFFARLAHAVIHISGFKYLMARTVVFCIAWITFLVYAITLLRNT